MSDQFLGEIRMFGFGRTPVGWQACDGSLLPISQNDALYSLLGTIYGGDGVNTFAVPDLRGRLPIHQGQGQGLSTYVIGQIAGTENVTLTSGQIPSHSHTLQVTTAASTATTPGPALLPGTVSGDTFYVNTIVGNTAAAMEPSMLANSGNSLPHENCMPTLTVQFCIATTGIYPSQN